MSGSGSGSGSSSSPTSMISYTPTSQGLSTGTKAAIGVTISVVLIISLLGVFFFCCRRRHGTTVETTSHGERKTPELEGTMKEPSMELDGSIVAQWATELHS